MTVQQESLTLLTELEDALKQHALWQEIAPEPDQLNSKLPFAIDSLSFAQWLQFVFLPRIYQQVSAEGALPAMNVAPAADIYLQEQAPHAQRTLVSIIVQLDRLSQEKSGD